MELSVRERQKALTVTLAMLCIACACLFYRHYKIFCVNGKYGIQV